MAAVISLIAVVTGVIDMVRPYASPLSLGALYIFAVLPAAFAWGLGLGLAAAIASFLVCDFAFLPPVHSLSLDNSVHALSLGLYATSALVGARLGREFRHGQGLLNKEREALRHLAVLVAHRAQASMVFSAIAEEVGELAGAETSDIVRFSSAGDVTVLAVWSTGGQRGPNCPIQVGELLPIDGHCVEALMLESGAAARIDDFRELPGTIAGQVRRSGNQSEVGAPIIVNGVVWGAVIVSSRSVFPSNTETRLTNFAQLAAIVVSHAEARSELVASRARIITSSDQARQRLERELHDGIQHQLVSIALRLNEMETALDGASQNVRATLNRVRRTLAEAMDELRVISRGAHPPVLLESGLGPALKALARRFPFDVLVDVDVDSRPSEAIETAIYHVVAEALTNVAKHAHANSVSVRVISVDKRLEASIKDDGAGGADPALGSGLIGLVDRVEALDGRLVLASPKGSGTTIRVELPLRLAQEAGVAEAPSAAGHRGPARGRARP